MHPRKTKTTDHPTAGLVHQLKEGPELMTPSTHLRGCSTSDSNCPIGTTVRLGSSTSSRCTPLACASTGPRAVPALQLKGQNF